MLAANFNAPRSIYRQDGCSWNVPCAANPCCSDYGMRNLMGLAADGSSPSTATSTNTQILAAIAARATAIRQQALTAGVPAAAIAGLSVMFTAAGAFGLAKTERVWLPSLYLGALTLISGLIGAAVVATNATATATAEANAAAGTGAPVPAGSTTPSIQTSLTPSPAAPLPGLGAGLGRAIYMSR